MLHARARKKSEGLCLETRTSRAVNIIARQPREVLACRACLAVRLATLSQRRASRDLRLGECLKEKGRRLVEDMTENSMIDCLVAMRIRGSLRAKKYTHSTRAALYSGCLPQGRQTER